MTLRPTKRAGYYLQAVASQGWYRAWAGLLACSGVLMACAAPTVSPELAARKGTFGTVAIMLDVAVVDDVSGEKVDKVDVLGNQKAGDLLLTTLTGALAQKDYRIGRTSLASVGSALSPPASFHVARSTEEQKVPAATLAIGEPPFYLEDTLARDLELSQAWGILIRAMPKYVRAKDKSTDPIPEATVLARAAESDTVLAIVLTGHMISSAKSIAQGLVTGVLTLGLATYWQTSTVAVYGILVDAHAGVVLWSGVAGLQARPDEASIRKLVTQLLGTLP